MITQKIIENEIESLVGLNNLVLAYEEIAASRIRNSRSSVLNTRDFMSEIREIFEEVIYSYKGQVEILVKSKKIKNQFEYGRQITAAVNFDVFGTSARASVMAYAASSRGRKRFFFRKFFPVAELGYGHAIRLKRP